MSKTYNACFVTTQGIPEKYGKDRKSLEINAINVLTEYLEKNKSVSAELRRTIIPI